MANGRRQVNKRLALFVALPFGLLRSLSAVEAQQGQRVYQVGLLSLGSPPTRSGLWQNVLEAMRELGYTEGRNLSFALSFADGRPERLPALAADLVRAKVDVIVTTSTQETQAAKKATSTIPIVMTLVPDPVEQGLIASLARPGGNITGLTTIAPGTSQKLFELLHEAVPSASLLAVLTSGSSSPFLEIRKELDAAARRAKITLTYTQRITRPDEIDSVLGQAKKDGAGGIIAPLGSFTYAYRVEVVQSALKHRLPGVYWVRDFVEEGGLMSYGISFQYVGRRAAYFVDRLLKGAKPADLPVEHPTKLEFVINLRTANALNLTIPQSLLVRADQVIQ